MFFEADVAQWEVQAGNKTVVTAQSLPAKNQAAVQLEFRPN